MMKNKNFLIGLFLVLVGGGIFWYFRQDEKPEPSPLLERIGVTQEEEAFLESQVGLEIPDDVEKTKLTDVDGEEAVGLATRDYEDGQFEHTVIASLPETAETEFYQGWLVDEEGEMVATEKLEEVKGGWVLSYTTDEDKTDCDRVVVTREAEDDNEPEEVVLEGQF